MQFYIGRIDIDTMSWVAWRSLPGKCSPATHPLRRGVGDLAVPTGAAVIQTLQGALQAALACERFLIYHLLVSAAGVAVARATDRRALTS